MSNRFKALGALAVVALTLALGVGTASATTAQFSSNEYPLALTGPVVEITTTSPEWFCNGTLSGEIAAKSTSISVTPEYNVLGGCWLQETWATVATEGCTYTFVAGTLTETGSAGSMSIVCPSGKEIHMTAGECAVKIPPTSKPIPISYENVKPETEGTAVYAHFFERPLSFWQNSKCGGTEGMHTATLAGHYTIESSNHLLTVS
jgi:hypothetical protein